MDLTIKVVAPAMTWLLVRIVLGPITMPVPAPTALWYPILVSMSTIVGPTCPTAARASNGAGGLDGDACAGTVPRASPRTAIRLSNHSPIRDRCGLGRCDSLIGIPPT